jgi:hypothetical protein
MKENDYKEVEKLLREALPPIDPNLRRDLWPLMLNRLGGSPALPWYDWALLGGTAGIVAFFPRLILLFAYHF